MKAIVIKTDNTFQEVDTKVNLGWLQDKVGGYIESITVNKGTMYVNEEGKLNGLPVNRLATVLVQNFSGISDIIMGDVVLLGRPNLKGMDTPVEAQYKNILERITGSKK